MPQPPETTEMGAKPLNFPVFQQNHLNRAGRKAGTAAGTPREIDLRLGGPPQGRLESQGSRITGFAADTALHPLIRQTIAADTGFK